MIGSMKLIEAIRRNIFMLINVLFATSTALVLCHRIAPRHVVNKIALRVWMCAGGVECGAK